MFVIETDKTFMKIGTHIHYKIFTNHHQHNYLLCFIKRVTRLHVSTIRRSTSKSP